MKMNKAQPLKPAAASAAKAWLAPSRRSDVPPFMVMDVMAAAARIEEAGGRVVHMEVGQPAARAPSTAIAAAKAALEGGRIGYTEALGIPSLRARISRHYAESYGARVDPARVVVTTGSSAGFILAFLARHGLLALRFRRMGLGPAFVRDRRPWQGKLGAGGNRVNAAPITKR